MSRELPARCFPRDGWRNQRFFAQYLSVISGKPEHEVQKRRMSHSGISRASIVAECRAIATEPGAVVLLVWWCCAYCFRSFSNSITKISRLFGGTMS